MGKTSWDCQEELFRQEVENADDIRLSYRLLRKCMGDKQKFCADIKPGGKPELPGPFLICANSPLAVTWRMFTAYMCPCEAPFELQQGHSQVHLACTAKNLQSTRIHASFSCSHRGPDCAWRDSLLADARLHWPGCNVVSSASLLCWSACRCTCPAWPLRRLCMCCMRPIQPGAEV